MSLIIWSLSRRPCRSSYAGRTFHGYGETPCSTPVMLRRKAVFPYHWPTGIVATSVIAACDTPLAAFSCPAASGAFTHCTASARASALSHQPNQPFAPRPVISGFVAGELAVAAEAERVLTPVASQPSGAIRHAGNRNLRRFRQGDGRRYAGRQ